MNELPVPHKVQYLALRGEIERLIEEGYNYRNTYNLLSAKGVLKMSYTNFVRYINTLGNAKQEEEKKLIDDDNKPSSNEISKKAIGIEKPSFGRREFNPDENI